MNKKNRNKNLFIFCGLAIPTLLLVLFVLYPMVELIHISFTNWNGATPTKEYVGLKNYKKMLFDSPNVWLSIRNNITYLIYDMVALVIALFLANTLNTKFFGNRFFRSIIFLPFILNGVAVAYSFSYFLSPINGGLNEILKAIGLGGTIKSWLSDKSIVNHSLSMVSVWKSIGYKVVLFIAALKSVPEDQLEAARVDGANAFARLRYIQIPSIWTVIQFLIFTSIVGCMQIFDLPFVMTQGGPENASSTFTLYSINSAFTYSNFGFAAAMAVLMIVIIIVIYTIPAGLFKLIRKVGKRKCSY